MQLGNCSTYVDRPVTQLLEDLATPVSLKVALLLRYEEWDQLSEMKVDPSHYLSSETYWADAQAVDLLRKVPDLPTTFDKRARSLETFYNCERKCLSTNIRLNPYLRPGLYQDEDLGVSAYFKRVRKIVKAILGPVPPLDELNGRFGPGATFGDKGRYITVPDKISSKPTFTPDSLRFLPLWARTKWASACSEVTGEVRVVNGNRFSSVPKDSTKERGIAIEPSVNVFYQLLFGSLIRKRLKRIGIDLNNGQDIHRRFACAASVKGDLATIDLKNASDTISYNLVKLLLPDDWFNYLSWLRSPKTEVDGHWVLLEKFSSMGNGFTFELETLIFLALIQGINPSSLTPGVNLLVYGDDVICPVELEREIRAVFSFCGLELNSGKSFFSGHFRESCGGDYFAGVDVRPHQMKKLPENPADLISLANGLRRSCKGFEWRSFQVRKAWFRVLDSIPMDIRSCRGPESLGDLVIHDDSSQWNYRLRNCIRWFRVYRPARFQRVGWEHFRPSVAFAAALYGCSSEPLTPRGKVLGYKIGRAASS